MDIQWPNPDSDRLLVAANKSKGTSQKLPARRPHVERWNRHRAFCSGLNAVCNLGRDGSWNIRSFLRIFFGWKREPFKKGKVFLLGFGSSLFCTTWQKQQNIQDFNPTKLGTSQPNLAHLTNPDYTENFCWSRDSGLDIICVNGICL